MPTLRLTPSFPPATWENQLIEARKLPSHELQRHALVSTRNGCHCYQCFCCAAVEVLAVRKAWERGCCRRCGAACEPTTDGQCGSCRGEEGK
jgi:hypothetical protein